MNKLIGLLLLPVILAVSCTTGQMSDNETVSDAKAESVIDDVTSATPDGTGWKINLTGVRNDQMWQSDMDEWKNKEAHKVEMTLEKKGVTSLYSGIAFSDVAAVVDDPAGGMPYVFQDSLWADGYDITLTSEDGYSYTFNTADVVASDIMLVDMIDGKAVSPRIAGNITGKAWIHDLVEIELGLFSVDLASNSFELELEINGINKSYTIAELEKMPIYIEDKGSFTNSHGNTTNSVYGGVKLIPLLEEVMEVSADTSIKIIAMDGYEMSYSGDMLLDQNNGYWILAFKENGAYMPEDPGYIRLVKAGPDNPNITGHVSARMIKKIVSEGKPFKNFELTIIEKDMNEVFDRQTMQSGVITNKNRVSYHDRKKNSDIPYMGISMWRLLERMEGYKSVIIEASDGFSVTLAAGELDGNDNVILAMYTGDNDELLSDSDWPLRLVWDKDSDVVPSGIKAVRNVVKLTLVY